MHNIVCRGSIKTHNLVCRTLYVQGTLRWLGGISEKIPPPILWCGIESLSPKEFESQLKQIFSSRSKKLENLIFSQPQRKIWLFRNSRLNFKKKYFEMKKSYDALN